MKKITAINILKKSITDCIKQNNTFGLYNLDDSDITLLAHTLLNTAETKIWLKPPSYETGKMSLDIYNGEYYPQIKHEWEE